MLEPKTETKLRNSIKQYEIDYDPTKINPPIIARKGLILVETLHKWKGENSRKIEEYLGLVKNLEKNRYYRITVGIS